jgi:hypothetical protein
MPLQVSRNPLASQEKEACMTEAPSAVFLADYQPYTHLVDTVELTFRLDPKAARTASLAPEWRGAEASVVPS